MLEFKTAIRLILRYRTASSTAVVVLAIAVASVLIVLSISDRIILRALPFHDPERLVMIHDRVMAPPNSFAALPQSTAHHLLNSQSFSALAYAAIDVRDRAIDEFGGDMARFGSASANIFEVLGISPLVGPRSPDAQSREEHLLYLSYSTWTSRFERDRDVVDRLLKSDDRSYRIVGVLPKDFILPASVSPERFDGLMIERVNRLNGTPRPRSLMVAPIARLRDGATTAAAQAEVNSIAAREATARDRPPITVQPLREGIFLGYAPYLWWAVTATLGVLLIAVTNVSILLVAAGRASQFSNAVRVTLGAPLLRLLLPGLYYSTLIALAGTLLGMLLWLWARAIVLRIVPATLTLTAVSDLDSRLTIASVGLVLVIICVLATPYVRSAWKGNQYTLAKSAQLTQVPESTRMILLGVQSAAAVIAVVLCAMSFLTYGRLISPPRGFTPEGLYAITSSHGYQKGASDRSQRLRSLKDAVLSVPGVTAVGTVDRLPVGRIAPIRDDWAELSLDGTTWAVSPGTFMTLGMRVLVGRSFSAAENDADAPVVVISEAGARALFGHPKDAVGRSVRVRERDRLIVGVVKDVRRYPGEFPTPALYLPIGSKDVQLWGTGIQMIVRVRPFLQLSAADVQNALDHHLGLGRISSYRRVADMDEEFLARPRFLSTVFGGAAAIALVLTLAASYSVSSFWIVTTRRELAVRLSLGASARELRSLIRVAVLRPILLGGLFGLLGAWWTARFVGSILSFSHADPEIYIASLAVVVMSAVGASIPTRGVGQIDTAEVLRAT